MSTWTNEKHEQAQVLAGGLTSPGEDTKARLSDALDEIERLRAESARRMVWLEREQKAHEQTRHALEDMTERAAHPEVNDERVERAARQVWGGVALFRDPDTLPSADSTDAGAAGMGRRYRRVARAALEAALNPPA